MEVERREEVSIRLAVEVEEEEREEENDESEVKLIVVEEEAKVREPLDRKLCGPRPAKVGPNFFPSVPPFSPFTEIFNFLKPLKFLVSISILSSSTSLPFPLDGPAVHRAGLRVDHLDPPHPPVCQGGSTCHLSLVTCFL